jgi:hypothetical protein
MTRLEKQINEEAAREYEEDIMSECKKCGNETRLEHSNDPCAVCGKEQ